MLVPASRGILGRMGDAPGEKPRFSSFSSPVESVGATEEGSGNKGVVIPPFSPGD